jgi:uncharacterized protein (TIRG00374 family)
MNITTKSAQSAAQSGDIRYPNRMKLVLRIFVWILVPLAAWWSIKDISLSAIGENFRQIGLQAILVLVVINMFIFVLFSFRWWTILRAQDLRVSLISVIGYRLAGFGVTYFTPGPQFGGEPLQVYLLKEKEGVATSPAATSVSIDKLLELLANFSFLLVGVTVLVFSGILNTGSRYVLILAPALLFAVPVIYLLALRTGRLPITFIFEKLGKILMHSKRYQGLLITLKETESLVSVFCRQNVKALLVGALLSLAIWALMVFEFGLMLQFLGVQFNLVQILVALTAARIAFLLPFPAGLGTLEAGQVMAMGLIGVSPAIGISLALLIRARDVLFGGAGLWLGGYYNR